MTKDLKHEIVKFRGGFYRVSSHRGGKVNLAGVFNGKILLKAIPEAAVVEAHDEFYIHWSQSETYQCM
jgi:hypothetical protein